MKMDDLGGTPIYGNPHVYIYNIYTYIYIYTYTYRYMPFTITIDMPLNAMNQTAAPATIISVDTFPDRPRQTSHAPVPLGSSHPGQSWEVVPSLGSYDGSTAMAKTIEEHILILIFDELPAQCRNDPRLHCRLSGYPHGFPFAEWWTPIDGKKGILQHASHTL